MNFKKTKLKNGLRVVTIPMKDNPTVTVLVLVEAGSKYETKDKNGLSHFLEHMCFKGTLKRANAHAITSELDGLGSQSNAFTGQEYTGYYAKSEAKHFKQIFDVVSDIYLNATFPEAEMQKEKGVIIEEINMYEDMPQRHVQDLFMELLYGDQPAGWNIAGPRENIRAMKREDFVKYKNAHYVPEATTIVVAGKVSEREVVSAVKKTFGTLPRRKKGTKLAVKEKQTKPATLVKFKATDQAHFVLGFRTFPVADKRNPTLSVLATVLAGGMSSRLFQKLREEMGVAYYVKAAGEPFTDHGFFEIFAGVDVKRITEVVGEILKECARLTTELVSEKELSKVKEYLSGNTKLELESSDAYAMYYGAQEILREKIKTPDEALAEIRKVTPQAIQKLAKTIFTDAHLNLAVIGPYQDDTLFQKVLRLP